MGKEYMVKALLDESVRDIDIPFIAIMNNGKAVDLCSTPSMLFSALSGADKQIGELNLKVKAWKRAAFITAIATGYLLVKNHDLKSQLKKQQRDFESVDLFDTELEENDI